MSLKIFLLTASPGKHPDTEYYDRLVVVASDEDEARSLSNWYTSKNTEEYGCQLLAQAHPYIHEGVIASSRIST